MVAGLIKIYGKTGKTVNSQGPTYFAIGYRTEPSGAHVLERPIAAVKYFDGQLVITGAREFLDGFLKGEYCPESWTARHRFQDHPLMSALRSTYGPYRFFDEADLAQYYDILHKIGGRTAVVTVEPVANRDSRRLARQHRPSPPAVESPQGSSELTPAQLLAGVRDPMRRRMIRALAENFQAESGDREVYNVVIERFVDPANWEELDAVYAEFVLGEA